MLITTTAERPHAGITAVLISCYYVLQIQTWHVCASNGACCLGCSVLETLTLVILLTGDIETTVLTRVGSHVFTGR